MTFVVGAFAYITSLKAYTVTHKST